MRRVFAFLFTLTLLGMTGLALADVPTEMSVQGRLTNAGGAPVPAGLKNFTFKIFDLPAAGVEIWPGGPGETQVLVTDANGLWNAGVGTVIPLTEAVFLSPVRWLEVTVDDGVNPIETLPRIELRTNPYTYRSATSQNADSLGGLSLFDIADRFVDTSGDVMTGQLSLDWVHHNLGSSLSIDNHNDAWFPYWNDDLGFGTWGVVSDVNGDGNNFNVGVATASRGNNNTVEGNYGVLSYAEGGGTQNYGVLASTGMNGTSNYSGYFASGDFVVAAPQTPGTGGVMLPSDAIDNAEILDEPGVAFSAIAAGAGPLLANSGTAQDFVTVTITTPAAGYVVVHGAATIRYNGTLLTNFSWVQIDQTAGGGFNARWAWSGAFSHAGTGNEYETLSLTRVYSLAAGSHTFRLEGNGWVSNNAAAADQVLQAELLATFIPSSYGTVSALVAERGDFEDATAVRITDPQAGIDTEAYQVDIRQLELKAAREQAEAEKARRELVEASLSALTSKDRGTTQEKK